MIISILYGVGGYSLLCLLIAKHKYDTPPWGSSLAMRFWKELSIGFIAYPFNICYWVFKLVVKIVLKVDKLIDQWLK